MKLKLHRVSSRGVAGAEALRVVSGGVLGRLGMMLSTRSRSASVLSITGPTLPVARRPGSPSCPCRGVGSIAKCESPTFAGDCPSEAPLGPDLPPARPRPATHPLPPRRGPHPGRRDRRPARPPPLHHLPRAGPQPLPRRRPRLLRLLPPERPGPGAATPAAASEAGHRTTACGSTWSGGSRTAGRRSRSPAGSSRSRRTAGRPSATRPSTATSTGPEGREDGLYRHLPKARRRRGSRYGRRPRSTPIPRERWIENRPAEVGEPGEPSATGRATC